MTVSLTVNLYIIDMHEYKTTRRCSHIAHMYAYCMHAWYACTYPCIVACAFKRNGLDCASTVGRATNLNKRGRYKHMCIMIRPKLVTCFTAQSMREVANGLTQIFATCVMWGWVMMQTGQQYNLKLIPTCLRSAQFSIQVLFQTTLDIAVNNHQVPGLVAFSRERLSRSSRLTNWHVTSREAKTKE